MKIIISPTDFSKNGNNAVEYAAALTKEFNSKLILINVYEGSSNAIAGEAEKELKKESTEKLNSLCKNLVDKYHIKTEFHLLSGSSAADTISSFAAKMPADVIVTGSTGTNLLERMIMGSTTSKLIHSSVCPVLCIPENISFTPIKRIAFATDLKEDNINAALTLITFARHFNAELCFLFVDDKDFIHSDENITEMTNRIRTRVRYQRMSGYVTKHADVNKGIKNFLSKQDAQILAMFTHADKSNSGRFSESITAHMSDHIKVPLLALKKEVVSLV